MGAECSEVEGSMIPCFSMFFVCQSTSKCRERVCSTEVYNHRPLGLGMIVELSSVGVTDFIASVSKNIFVIIKKSC